MCGIDKLITGFNSLKNVFSGLSSVNSISSGLSSAHSISGAIANAAPSATSIANTGSTISSTASTISNVASGAKNLGAIAGVVGGLGSLGAGLLSMKGNKSGTATTQIINSALENQTTPLEEVAKTATTVRQSDISKIQRSLGALRIKQNNANSYSGVNTASSALNLNLGG